MQQGVSPAPAVRDHKEVMDRINDGTWLPLNSTTCTHVDRGFEDCVNEALGCLEDPERFWVAVDVKAARHAGIKPIPPLPPSF
jgi:hypothetical protein